MIGTSTGVYRILDKLGAGGIRGVCRPHDSRLHRTVTFEVLSFEFSADPERRARFHRGARVLASLSYSNDRTCDVRITAKSACRS